MDYKLFENRSHVFFVQYVYVDWTLHLLGTQYILGKWMAQTLRDIL
jgi:hypothetical protein